MKKVRMLWMPLLLGVLLMATLVGAAGARPSPKPEASPQLQNLMISAHHCIPDEDTTDWNHNRSYVECETAICYLVCPIKPPHEGLIRVQRLALYAYDNDTAAVGISLVHVYPKTGTYVNRIFDELTSDSEDDPQVISYNPANFKVSQLQDLYVYVVISGTTQKLYGFKLKYEPL